MRDEKLINRLRAEIDNLRETVALRDHRIVKLEELLGCYQEGKLDEPPTDWPFGPDQTPEAGFTPGYTGCNPWSPSNPEWAAAAAPVLERLLETPNPVDQEGDSTRPGSSDQK